MDFYVVIPDNQHPAPGDEPLIKREGYSGDDATYWVEPGGVLVAGGLNDDSFRGWRVYAPGTWIRVESDQAPMRPAESGNAVECDPSTGRQFG
jgi:hypothetical protein